MQTFLAFIVALGVLIVVHELGHYWVARLCNVRVLRFAIGFGRPLLVRQRGTDRTEWVLAAIPFGGYVKMLDEREGPVEPSELHRAFNRQGVAKRFAIVAAGPIFNFLFAILLYWGLFLHGMPEAKPVLAAPPPGSVAAAAGFQDGDTVLSIDGEAVATWKDLRWRIVQGALEHGVLRVEILSTGERGSRHVSEIRLDLRDSGDGAPDTDLVARIGLQLYRPALKPVIGQVVADSPAAKVGLQTRDRITQAGGKPVESWTEFVRIVRAYPEKPLPITFERAGVAQTVVVVPDAVQEKGERIGRIGAGLDVPADYAERMLVTVRHGPVEGLARAVAETWSIAGFSLRMFGKMLIGEVSWKNLSGPVTIADFAGQSAQLGWMPYLTFLALISISLGILNLLPIPLLDGGHLLFYLIEIVTRRPLSERVLEVLQRIGLALLVVLMAFALYNDLQRVLAG